AVIAVRSELARDPGSAIVIAGPVPGSDVRQASKLVAEAVRGPRVAGDHTGLSATIAVSLQSGILRFTGHGRRGSRLESQMITLPSLARHVRLIKGTCDLTAGAAEGRFVAAAFLRRLPRRFTWL